MVICIILLPFVWMLLAAANKSHREETGVPMPTRGAMRGIRRQARKKGISEAEAYNQWLVRKQKRAGIQLPSGNSAHAFDGAIQRRRAWAPDDLSRIASDTPPVPTKAVRIRPEPHELFHLDHLRMIAGTYGWKLQRQAGGLYYLLDKNKENH
jgi:hypothetical protein